MSMKEVRDVVLQLSTLNAPKPDGFLSVFYQFYSSTIRPSLTKAVSNFFLHGMYTSSLNSNNMVLILKMQHPTTISHFRPISFCNNLYKIVSMILVNRLKPFLNELILENQSTFVSGRMIQDNIVIAHEIFHFLKNRKRGKYCFVPSR